MPPIASPVEILAPAGDEAAIQAALAAGAGAVFFGLGELDARRGAQGITASRLPEVVKAVHAGGAKAHLTLNITLAARELGRAARTLAWAEQCGVDAVLVCDPALLALAPCFPRVEIHFSTQAGIASSAGVRAAKILGATRVVLARELSLEEIRPCVGHGVEIEVFAQGALCFSVSGHCSMTSWVGGRSGNRGTCTSICRVNWSCNDAHFGRPLDMKDNSAVRVIPDLLAIGVDSLKIEGRLKTPAWVGEAVGLYRRAIAGEASADELWTEAQQLGAYTGREMTDAYFTGKRVGLVHPDEGRIAAIDPPQDDQDPPRPVIVTCRKEQMRVHWEVHHGTAVETFSTTAPPAKKGRAVDAWELRTRIAEALPDGLALADEVDFGNLVLPRRTANDVAEHIAAWLRRLADDRIDRLKIDIGDAARAILAPRERHPANRLTSTAQADRARVDAEAAAAFARAVSEPTLVVELREAAAVEALHAAIGPRLIVALPTVIYDGDLPALAAVVATAVRLDLAVEVNGWDGWWLVREAGATWEAGPGLAVLNAVAARHLATLGCRAAMISCEADAGKLAACCADADTPLILPVFGRPALMSTRAWSKAPGWTMSDARGSITIAPRKEGPVVVLRPAEPYDWRGRAIADVAAAHVEMDLSASPDPVGEWRSRPDPKVHVFNLDRDLR